MDGPARDVWEDRSVYLQARTRTRRKGPRRLWPRWTLRLATASAAEAYDVLALLQGDDAGEIDWCPRTRAPGDPPALTETTYRARVVGSLATLSPVYLHRQGVWLFDIELEGVEPYEALPGLVRVDALAYLLDADGAALLADPDHALLG